MELHASNHMKACCIIGSRKIANETLSLVGALIYLAMIVLHARSIVCDSESRNRPFTPHNHFALAHVHLARAFVRSSYYQHAFPTAVYRILLASPGTWSQACHMATLHQLLQDLFRRNGAHFSQGQNHVPPTTLFRDGGLWRRVRAK